MKTPVALYLQCCLLVAALGLAGRAAAGVLPEDRADVLYHVYDGGGVEIDGPSVLVRKSFLEKFSVQGNFYMDMVSSASIDVVTTASPYKEERTQWSLNADAIRGKTIYSLGYTNSDEDDYQADTAYFGLSQDLFGDLTTVSLGFSRAWDTVRRRNATGSGVDPTFDESVDRRNYRIGVSQILTKNLIIGAAFEAITDEGFLNNPYRSVRYVDPTSGVGYSFEAEIYPQTRTSNAIAINARYHLPYRAAVHGDYRFFTDTWGIDAHTVELGYTHPWGPKWIFEGSARYYTQSRADFYADLFPRSQAQNFEARDKELATFKSNSVGVGVSYEFPGGRPRFVQKGTLNLRIDHVWFDYDDFRDLRVTGVAPGTEPLYSFSANVMQFFASIWF
ncbi:MAG TPA: DUF3570 domain-containing protein [Steroidobacteraceae bacterium]|nr:DUF3570 domain-containing protein [Steroidobacteraceae bacterium]